MSQQDPMRHPMLPEEPVVEVEEAKPSRAARRSPTLIHVIASFAALITLVVLTVVFELILKGESHFLKAENLVNILRQYAFIGIIAIGMTFVIISGGIDLSVGSMVAFIAGLLIWCMNYVYTLPGGGWLLEHSALVDFTVPLLDWRITIALQAIAVLAIGFGLAALLGSAAGAVHGVLIAYGRIAPFIATLGGLAVYRSLSLAIARGGEYRHAGPDLFAGIGVEGIAIPFTNLAAEGRPPIPHTLPWPVIFFFAIAILGGILLRRTRYGRHVIAVGANEQAARYAAVPVRRVKVVTYALIGLCTGIAAMLLASRLNAIASSTTGMLYELDIIAAVVIGGTSMRGGRGTIIGTVIGVIILAVIGNMLNMLQVSTYLQGTVKGLVIIAAVLLQRSGNDN